MKNQFTSYPAIIASVMLFLATAPLPYGYYDFLRVMVTIISGYYAYWVFKRSVEKTFWFWGLITIAILFNPIIPVHLGDKGIWTVLNIISVLFFLMFLLRYKALNSKKPFTMLCIIVAIIFVLMSSIGMITPEEPKKLLLPLPPLPGLPKKSSGDIDFNFDNDFNFDL